MERPSRGFWFLWTALFLFNVATLIYVSFATVAATTPLSSLSPFFWIFLITLCLLVLAPTVVAGDYTKWGEQAGRRRVPSEHRALVPLPLVVGGLFLFLAIYNKAAEPEGGGTTAIFAMLGIVQLARAFFYARRAWLGGNQ